MGSRTDFKNVESLPTEIEGIADIIANFHDWDSENLKAEFMSCVLASFPDISTGLVSQVFENFQVIEIQTRFHRDFDHKRFVSNQFSDFIGTS